MPFTQTHQPCPSCQSSDGLSYNEDGSSYCFVCQQFTPTGKQESATIIPITKAKPVSLSQQHIDKFSADRFRSLQDRGLSSETCKQYSIVRDGESTLFGYKDTQNRYVAVKTRTKSKDFSVNGDWQDALLFGQWLYPKGGKYITLCEGEADAAAAYQLLGSKYPVVSIRNGAASALKDCKKHYEYLDSFESIVICFDADEAGRKAAAQVGELFGTKAKIVHHKQGLKDANDYLINSRGSEFPAVWWSAEAFVPDGIVQGATLLDDVMKPLEKAAVSYPFAALQKITYGIREAELVTITAGSGLGKSQFVRELVYHVLNNTNDNVGLLFLEESIRKTALSIMSLAANKPLHLPDTEATDEEKHAAFEATLGTGRMYLFNHFGSTSVDNIVSRVRYMAKSLECKYLFVDHISIIVSAQQSGDERKAIDEIMTKLRMLVQETGIALFCVSHLKRPDSKGHEEGAVTSLAQLRGSGSIAQLSDMVIGLERNGQADDPIERNTTSVRVLKNRYCGITGKAGALLYNIRSGRMIEVDETQEEL